VRIAAVLAAYSRREKTLACLAALRSQKLPPDVSLQVFLTDDASPDGTGIAVGSEFPEVIVLAGTGSLFWAGGMRLAFGEALRHDFDGYLWLNDDTVLFADAVARLLRTSGELHAVGAAKSIVVGATCDGCNGELTYSGAAHSSRYHPLKFRLVVPDEVPVACDTFNGNCVLIPREAAAVVGNISTGFTQAMGDFDYGLRARGLGCSIWVAPGFVGTCARNSVAGSWQDVSLPLRARWHVVLGPKGLPPAEYRRYATRHAGRLWPVYWAMPYARLLLSGMLPNAFDAQP
jgi:GT2 family glycosyltransferase